MIVIYISVLGAVAQGNLGYVAIIIILVGICNGSIIVDLGGDGFDKGRGFRIIPRRI